MSVEGLIVAGVDPGFSKGDATVMYGHHGMGDSARGRPPPPSFEKICLIAIQIAPE